MGAAYTKFKELPVGTGNVTGKLGKCISPSCVSKEPMKITIKSDSWNKTSTGAIAKPCLYQCAHIRLCPCAQVAVAVSSHQ